MVAKLYRRLSPKSFILGVIVLTLILCVYYAHNTYNVGQNVGQSRALKAEIVEEMPGIEIAHNTYNVGQNVGQSRALKAEIVEEMPGIEIQSETEKKEFSENAPTRKLGACLNLIPSEADINTVDVFRDFEFQPTWMRSKEYWDKSFEDRYERQKMDPERPPLKVIIVPHSHNDPGWLKTFENYFHSQSRQIINLMIAKMQEYHNLTFIWSEISFLNAWWEGAHPSKQRALKSLANSGRLEITTGGWVMTDSS
ncbi:Glycosyl hydrolases family 38 N-terminal domain [Popillia japonica]|uniref:Glycosyl hydrolases family 38 N-terminal domain n=1 Tax=Popillia japonica TaxID=7064 RepID=A0AAW1NBJ1_POPJA